MPDLSNYTDDELMQSAGVAPAVSSMSDDDLLKIANQPDKADLPPSTPLIYRNDLDVNAKSIRDFAGPDLEKKFWNAASIAATYDIPESAALDLHDSFVNKIGEANLWDKAVGSFKAGWGDMYSSIGGIMKRKGVAPEWADNYVDFGERLKRAYIPATDQSEFTWRKMKDPEWYATTIMRSVPFTLSLVPAAVVGAYGGAAVAGVAGLGAFGTTVLGAIGGAVLSRPVEASFEAQGAFEEAKQKGFDDIEAEGTAGKVFWDNMKLVGLDAAEFATAFLPMGKIAGSTVKRAIGKRVLAATGKLGAVGAMEMGEERYQEAAVMNATGQDTSFFDFSDPRLNEAGAAGAVFGVGLGGAGSVWTALHGKVTETMTGKPKFVYDKAKEAAIAQGVEGTAAEVQALDAVASTPEGKAHIESVVSDLKDLAEGRPAKEKALKTEGDNLPFIFGVNEDANGEVSTFTMADPVSGQTFDVPALKTEEKDKISMKPDMAAVNVKLKEIRQADEIDTQIDQLIKGEEDIDAASGRMFGETEQVEDVPDFEDEAAPQTIIDRVKTINDSMGEKGSVDLSPLVDLGRSIWAEGHQTIEAFTARAKELLGDVWNKVQYHIQAAWNVLNNERGSVNIGGVTEKPGTANTPPETTPKAVGGVEVYHGTPHEFDKFSMQAIGTGEGGQSFGWGLYFSDSKDIANHYAKRLNKENVSFLGEIPADAKDGFHNLEWFIGRTKQHPNSPAINNAQDIKDFLKENKENLNIKRNKDAKLDDILQSIEYLINKYPDKIIFPNFKNLKVRLNTSQDKLLDFDEPLTNDILNRVIEKASERGIKLNKPDFMIRKNDDELTTTNQIGANGDVLYKVIKDELGYNLFDSDKKASLFLKDLGFDGIKYKSSELFGGKRSKTINNYVIFNEDIIDLLPNPTRPPEVGGQTLYSGVDPTQIIPVLKSLKNNIQEAMPHLEALGLKAYESGKNTFEAWSGQMKSYLGDLWESFKDVMAQVWESVKSFNEQLGERGSFSTKKTIRESTGQVKPTDKKVSEYDALTGKLKRESVVAKKADQKLNSELKEAFKEAAQDAREAFKAGKEEELAKAKDRMNKLYRRQESIRNVREYFNFTDSDMSKVSRKNPLFMSDFEFHEYLGNVRTKAMELADNQQAKAELMKLIEDRRLQKVDNYRKAMQLPSINDMTTEQLREFAKLLEPFQDDDVFLTQRELETVDRTDALKGARTWREARESMVKEIQTRRPEVELKDLAGVKVAWNASWKWDSVLREQDPFFELLVHDMTTAQLSADMKIQDVETQVFDLAKKADKSRVRTVSEKLIPQDKQIFQWLEAPAEEKNAIAQQMTPEQLNYADFMINYFADALDYLMSIKAVEKGRENYITHVRKSFMENARNKGIVKATSEIFTQMEEDQMTFNILDDDTGNILPLEKFFQFQMHRNGGIDPTTNVTRAFRTYVRTFERKKMYDAIIPKLDIYTQSLTPTFYTPRGLEIDASLKKFVNTYINNKKGRHISFNSVIRQGGPVDVMLRAAKTFTSMLDLGFFVPAQAINFMGEQLTTFVPLGFTDYAKSIVLLRTDKGKRIAKKYEAFTGRSLWENFSAPEKQINERIMAGMFGFFHISTVAANKQFLLASMTEQEWNNEELSTERLAEIKLEMGRFRSVPGDESIIGSTSLGKSVAQYKTWAVSPTRTLITDLETMAKTLSQKKYGEAFTAKEAREVYRIIGTTASMVMVVALAGAEDDDNSVIGKMKKRAIREVFSLTAGMDPAFWLSWRTASYLKQLGTALKNLLFLETYKTKEGLKGVGQLKKAVIPGAIRNIIPEEEK